MNRKATYMLLYFRVLSVRLLLQLGDDLLDLLVSLGNQSIPQLVLLSHVRHRARNTDIHTFALI